MAEIVNLRRARKDKARQQRESEADASSAVCTYRPRAMKPIEDQIEVAGWNSGPAVAHDNARGAFICRHGHTHRAAVRRELECVRQQVRHDAIEMIGVAVDDRRL